MRRFDGAGSAQRPGSRRHASCLHGDVAEYRRCLTDFFTECLRDGLRLAYVSSDGADAARADLADLSDLDRLLAAGALHVLSARDLYGAGGPVEIQNGSWPRSRPRPSRPWPTGSVGWR